MSMEGIVRPFVGQRIVSPVPVVDSNFADPETVHVSLGGAGGRSVSYSFSNEGVVIPSKTDTFREASRTQVSKRVENPDDPSQFVEFCQASSVRMAPDRRITTPPRTSSFDLSGGYHDLTGNSGNFQSENTTYHYKTDSTTTCSNPNTPATGCQG